MKRRKKTLRELTNITITRYDRFQSFKEKAKSFPDLEFLKAIDEDKRNQCFDLLTRSHSQLRQDLFALSTLDFKRDGYFLEFGATDGVSLSNTFLMEKEFGWTGILAEPARLWQDQLKTNRSAVIDTRCVWRESGDSIEFTEAPRGENSGVASFVERRRRVRGKTYSVHTISLNDLLKEHKAPDIIDYFSIDTEGTEYEILRNFDFSRFSFRVITVEHNFAAQRKEIFNLLTSNGYTRVLENISNFDDWYILG